MLAIAHNGNVSNGQMFPVKRMNGRSIDRNYAETRMRWEPLYEVTQMKGDGEAHPALSPTDESPIMAPGTKLTLRVSNRKKIGCCSTNTPELRFR